MNDTDGRSSDHRDFGEPADARMRSKEERPIDRARMMLASIMRQTRWGPHPDPVAQDVLRSPSCEEILKRIPPGAAHLDSGRSAIVLSLPDGNRVVRIAPVQERAPIPEMLQALSRTISGNWQIEELPRVAMDASQSDVEEMKQSIQLRGYSFVDAEIDNVGRTKDGRLVVVDAESVERKRPAHAHAAESATSRISASEHRHATIRYADGPSRSGAPKPRPVTYVGTSPAAHSSMRGATWEQALQTDFFVGRDGTAEECAMKYRAQLDERARAHPPTRAALNRIAIVALDQGTVTIVADASAGWHSKAIAETLRSAIQRMGHSVRVEQAGTTKGLSRRDQNDLTGSLHT
jgi:hypothetical protein